ncbi:MAG: hypothetical protein R3D56_02850 [Paracoccaceae bacterium]
MSPRVFLREGDSPGALDHATALAALIAAPGDGHASTGFARKARLVSAVALAQGTGGDVAHGRDRGCTRLARGEGVPLVNLSLAGA